MGDEDVLADREAAVLGEVAGDEVGRARRDRRAQDDRVARRAGAPSRSSSAERMSRMSISMCENDGVPERDDDVRRPRAASATRSDSSSVPAACTRSSDLLGAGLVERHPRRRGRPQALGVVVDAEHVQPAVGEREGERQADPAEADDGDVERA